jgi:hypothetical protein
MRYECAILQNKIHKIPVVPVFMSEIVEVNRAPTHIPFDFAKIKASLPHTTHAREPTAQKSIEKLRYFFFLIAFLIFDF